MESNTELGLAHGVTGNDGREEGIAEGRGGANHTGDEEVGNSHGGDVGLRQLIGVGKDGSGDGADLEEGADGPDVVAPFLMVMGCRTCR